MCVRVCVWFGSGWPCDRAAVHASDDYYYCFLLAPKFVIHPLIRRLTPPSRALSYYPPGHPPQALETYQRGLGIEADNKACKDGLAKTMRMVNSSTGSGEVDRERAAHGMADPEIQVLPSHVVEK